jgi:phenylpropionate dioxygenase-like ring-hydroxylating dioxygenase large terminal subunit
MLRSSQRPRPAFVRAALADGHHGLMDAGSYSVAFPRRWWYPVARSSELGRRPLAVTLMDSPLVVFRGANRAPAVLLDRCEHRNYPLSLGRVTGNGELECGYHGWTYGGGGHCVRVPGLRGGRRQAHPDRHIPSHATVEQDGIVWAWGEPDAEPIRRPFDLPAVDGRGAGEVLFRHDLDSTMRASLENALDVPHTAFLHRGIFRGGLPHAITAVRRPVDGGVEVRYLGEPVGLGPLRLPGDSGRTFDHWDRFFLPSIAQIEYAVDGWFRLVNTIVHLPMSPFRTRAWFVVRFESRLPASVVRAVVRQHGRRILRQDADALARQTERARSLGGERYASTELDLLGPAIWHLLRRAERAEQLDGGDAAPATVRERTIVFEA